MNRKVFFEYVRNAPFGGRLTQSQKEGLEKGLDWLEKLNVTDNRHKAYVLATAFWETDRTIQPVRETLATSDAQAIRRLENAWKAGKLPSVKTPYWRDGWFGRGIVQLTWKENYARMGGVLGVDLVGNPSLMLNSDLSWQVTIIGMKKGLFAREQTLERYFNDKVDDPVGARRIVNGTNKARLIAGFHKNFLDALEAAEKLPATPVAKSEEKALTDDLKVTESPSVITVLTGIGSTGILSAFGGIDNAFALAAVATAVVAGSVLAYLFYSGKLTINKGQ